MQLSKREAGKLQKEAAIVEKARQLFCEHGFEQTSMNMLSEQTGFTKRTLYQYFVCKEDLFYAVILSGYKELWQTVERSLKDAGGTGFERLERAYFGFYKFYREQPGLLKLMGMTGAVKQASEGMALVYRDRYFTFDQQMFASIGTLFEQGQEDGSIRSDIGLAYLMYSAVFSLTGFFHMLGVTGRGYLCVADMDEETFIETSLRLFLDSLKA
ncbi:MAG: TetR/AcrR family transcriptional regulator [Christensenella sp.]|uniref:TetR/AcrR family transcriptional regulator n=1 Tax=Christensenella sp. TaxID=1935934 RepID=UPI002B1F9F50|nr:TetR/AcrR family transcriptional regulator [Christensenella sp.]MEA5002233.1 TetR/AcrR family transcriptional regulator [Christensenella sp.]